MASARSPAWAIFASSSASSTVVKRTWLARVWRWMKVAFSGAVISGSALPWPWSRRNSPARRCGGSSAARRSRPASRASSAAITRRLSSRSARAWSSSGRTPAATKPPSRARCRQVGAQARRPAARWKASEVGVRAGSSAVSAWASSAGGPVQRIARRRRTGRPAPRRSARPSRRQPRSRGPPRPSARRDRRAGHVGRALQARRAAARAAAGARSSQSTASSRASIAVGVEQRPRQPRGQQARAAGGDRAVDGGQQRALAAAGLAPLDLQAGAGGRVDGHDVGLAGAARRRAAPAAGRPGWSPGARRSGPAPRSPRRDSAPKPSRVSTP